MLPRLQVCALPAPAVQNFGVPATCYGGHLDRPEVRSEPSMAASLDARTWLRTSMSILLGFPCDEVADYVLTLPSLDTMREHIESFAGEAHVHWGVAFDARASGAGPGTQAKSLLLCQQQRFCVAFVTSQARAGRWTSWCRSSGPGLAKLPLPRSAPSPAAAVGASSR